MDDWDATEVAHLNGTELTDMTQQFYVTAFRLAKKGGSHDEVADMLKSEVKEWQEKVCLCVCVILQLVFEIVPRGGEVIDGTCLWSHGRFL